MAKLERALQENFDGLLARIEQGILEGSVSASLEASSDFSEGGARCSVRVFERYSYAGGNRLSMSVTLFQSGGGPVHLSAITAGGQPGAVFQDQHLGRGGLPGQTPGTAVSRAPRPV